mgnify:CR=1 FL=1
MAANLSTILQSIRQKAMELSARCDELEKENAMARAVIADLRAQNEQLEREMQALRSDNDFLIVSHRLAQSPDEIVKGRRLITGWIREIDRCIAELKQ